MEGSQGGDDETDEPGETTVHGYVCKHCDVFAYSCDVCSEPIFPASGEPVEAKRCIGCGRTDCRRLQFDDGFAIESCNEARMIQRVLKPVESERDSLRSQLAASEERVRELEEQLMATVEERNQALRKANDMRSFRDAAILERGAAWAAMSPDERKLADELVAHEVTRGELRKRDAVVEAARVALEWIDNEKKAWPQLRFELMRGTLRDALSALTQPQPDPAPVAGNWKSNMGATDGE